MNIEMYTTQTCPYCASAKALLQKEGLEYTEIDVSTDADKAREMVERSGRRTVPQIFLDGQSIGGFTELLKLNGAGELVKT